MPRFDCQLLNMNAIGKSSGKLPCSLCSRCVNYSCENPIEERKISIMGDIYTGRFYKTYTDYFLVTECEGFTESLEEEWPEEGEDEEDD